MTPQDLRQIGDLLDEKLNEKLDEKLSVIKIDVSSLKSDISSLKTDISSLKSDITVLKYQSNENQKSITKLNDSVLKWKSDIF